jgi:hypothetical protein
MKFTKIRVTGQKMLGTTRREPRRAQRRDKQFNRGAGRQKKGEIHEFDSFQGTTFTSGNKNYSRET